MKKTYKQNLQPLRTNTGFSRALVSRAAQAGRMGLFAFCILFLSVAMHLLYITIYVVLCLACA